MTMTFLNVASNSETGRHAFLQSIFFTYPFPARDFPGPNWQAPPNQLAAGWLLDSCPSTNANLILV